MSETILKGKINYYTYIWHTEKGACEKCQALDGLNFKNTDEIPDKPHPNCRCWIEVSEENDNKDDLCDCWKFYDEIEEMIGDLQSLEEEMESEQNDIIIFLDSLNKNIKEYIQNEINNLIDCFNKIATFIEAIKIFKSNFEQLLNTQNGAYDKYYHAKANCEATNNLTYTLKVFCKP